MTVKANKPGGQPALIQSDNVAAFEPTEKQFQQLADIARVRLDENEETLAALGADALVRAEYSVLQAGAYFLALRAKTAAPGTRKDLRTTLSGGFEAALERAGVHPRQARRAMQIAAYIAALPPDQAKRIASLPKTKVLPLINADPEVVGELLHEGALDGDQPLSVRELREKLKALENENTRLETSVKNAQADAKRRRAVETDADYPDFVRETRQESIELSTQISLCMETLEDVAARNLLADLKHPDALRFQPIAANTLVQALGSQIKRGIDLLAAIQARFGDSISTVTLDDHRLDPLELKLFEGALERLTKTHQAARKGRDDERANSAPGKRGRKRGS